MFYSIDLLHKKSPLGQLWLAGNNNASKITKRAIYAADVVSMSDTIIHPTAPMALRLQAKLMYGLVLIHGRKTKYVLDDASDFHTRMKMNINATESRIELREGHNRFESVTITNVTNLPLMDVSQILGEGQPILEDMIHGSQFTTIGSIMNIDITQHPSSVTLANRVDITLQEHGQDDIELPQLGEDMFMTSFDGDLNDLFDGAPLAPDSIQESSMHDIEDVDAARSEEHPKEDHYPLMDGLQDDIQPQPTAEEERDMRPKSSRRAKRRKTPWVDSEVKIDRATMDNCQATYSDLLIERPGVSTTSVKKGVDLYVSEVDLGGDLKSFWEHRTKLCRTDRADGTKKRQVNGADVYQDGMSEYYQNDVMMQDGDIGTDGITNDYNEFDLFGMSEGRDTQDTSSIERLRGVFAPPTPQEAEEFRKMKDISRISGHSRRDSASRKLDFETPTSRRRSRSSAGSRLSTGLGDLGIPEEDFSATPMSDIQLLTQPESVPLSQFELQEEMLKSQKAHFSQKAMEIQTYRFQEFLRSQFHENELVTFAAITANEKRLVAAQAFHEVLALTTHGHVTVFQDHSYGDIAIAPSHDFPETADPGASQMSPLEGHEMAGTPISVA